MLEEPVVCYPPLGRKRNRCSEFVKPADIQALGLLKAKWRVVVCVHGMCLYCEVLLEIGKA